MGEFFENTFTVSPDQPILIGATMKSFSIPHYQNLFRNSKDDIFHELVAMVEPVQKAA